MQEKITYPTDTKLHQRIIKKCVGIVRSEDIELRQNYKFTLKKLNVLLRFRYTKSGSVHARKPRKKIKTIADRLERELRRKKAKMSFEDQLIIRTLLRGKLNKIGSRSNQGNFLHK